MLATAPANSPTHVNANQLALSAALGSFVLQDWLRQGQEYQNSVGGKLEHWLIPGSSGITSFEQAKPAVEAFIKRWQELTQSGQYQDTQAIVKAIASEGGISGQGAEIFRQMLGQQDPGTSAPDTSKNFHYQLSGSTQTVLSSLLNHEGQDMGSRLVESLQAARYLAGNQNAPMASYLICESLKGHPLLKDEAAAIQQSIPAARTLSTVHEMITSPLTALGVGAVRGAYGMIKAASNGGVMPTALGGSALFHAGAAAAWYEKLNNEEQFNKERAQVNDTRTATGSVVSELNKASSEFSNTSLQDSAVIARNYLERRYKGTTGTVSNLNANELLLRAEISASGSELMNMPQDYLKRMADLRTDVQNSVKQITERGGNFDEQLEAVRKRVFEEINLYRKDKTFAADALDGGGTNCQGRARLMIDALQHSGIELPAGKTLGLQFYNGHVEPVIYDSSSGHAIGLVDRMTRLEIDNPIYKPDVMLHGFAAANGSTPDVKLSSYLIAGPENMNDKLIDGKFMSLPRGNTEYLLSKVPSYGFTEYNAMSSELIYDRKNTSPLQQHSDQKHYEIASYSLWEEDLINHSERFYIDSDNQVSFKNKNDEEAYKSLPPVEGALMLRAMAVSQYQRFLKDNSQDLAEFTKALETTDVSNLAKHAERWHQLATGISTFKATIDCLNDANQKRFNIPPDTSHIENSLTTMLIAAEESFTKAALARPNEVISELNKQEFRDKLLAISLFSEIRTDEKRDLFQRLFSSVSAVNNATERGPKHLDTTANKDTSDLKQLASPALPTLSEHTDSTETRRITVTLSGGGRRATSLTTEATIVTTLLAFISAQKEDNRFDPQDDAALTKTKFERSEKNLDLLYNLLKDQPKDKLLAALQIASSLPSAEDAYNNYFLGNQADSSPELRKLLMPLLKQVIGK
ncbi:MAG: hypothetical protein PHC51_04515 [bacterium]|nr:hypothetical protein [bacterium]